MSDIMIYKADGSIRMRAHIGAGSKRFFTLMEKDYIALKFTVADAVVLHAGDFIKLPDIGRYELLAEYKPERDPLGDGYTYQPQFEAQYRKFSNKLMKFIPGVGASETSWTLTQNIVGHATQILYNMMMLSHIHRGENTVVRTEDGGIIRLEVQSEVGGLNLQNYILEEYNDGYLWNGDTPWVVNIHPEVSAKYVTMTYSSTNILDAIADLSKQLECEWWFEDNVLHFGKCQYGDEPIEISETLPYEYNGLQREGNLCKSSRSDSKESNATRLYVYGSNRNLPSTYRKRLVFTATVDPLGGVYDVARPIIGDYFPASLQNTPMLNLSAVMAHDENGNSEFIHSGGSGPNGAQIYTDTFRLKKQHPAGSSADPLIFSLPIDFYTINLSNFHPQITIATISGECPTKALGTLRIEAKTSEIQEQYELIKDVNSHPGIITSEVEIKNSAPTVFSFDNIKYKPDNTIYGMRFTFTVNLVYEASSRFVREVTRSSNIEGVNYTSVIGISESNPIKYVENVTIDVINRKTGGTARTISNVGFNLKLRKKEENPDLTRPLGCSDEQWLHEGEMYEIREINTALVPASYFTNKYTILEKYAHYTTNGIVTNRLLLPEDLAPNGYIDVIPIGSEEEAIEDVVTFEEIYPHRLSHVTEVTDDTNYEEQPEMSGEITKKPYPVYSIRDNFFNEDNPFKVDTYKLQNQELEIYFQGVLTYKDLRWKETHDGQLPEGVNSEDEPVYKGGGHLTGMKFKVSWLSNNRFQIQRDDNLKVPDEYLRPMIGDTYILTGFNVAMVADVDADYIGNAEQLLWDKAMEYKRELNTDASTYNCTIACDWAKQRIESFSGSGGLCFGLGQKVNLINPAYFLDGRISRIIGWEIPLDFPYDNPVYIVGEKAKYSRLGEMQNALDSLQFKAESAYLGLVGTSVTPELGSGDSGGVYLIKENDTTVARDTNAYSAKRADREMEMRSLSKIHDDRSPFTIATDKGLEVGTYRAEESGGVFGVDNNGESYIEADRLRVRKTALFHELEVAKATTIGGRQIITPGGGAVIASVVEIYQSDMLYGYKCYLECSDGENNITAPFRVRDLIYCQTFNLRNTGGTESMNRYYWRECIEVGRDYLVLSLTGDTDSAAPMAGDTIIQLGSVTDTQRQSAIVIDTVGNFKPSIVLYSGINGYTLANRSEVSIGMRDGVPFLDAYGDFYFGSKDGSSTFIRYDSTNQQLDIKARIDVTSPVGDRTIGDLAEGGDDTRTTIDGGLVTTGSLVVATGNVEQAGISSGGDGNAVRLWAGATKQGRSSAPFRVNHDGSMVATNADIRGAIKADSLTLGGSSAIIVKEPMGVTLPPLEQGYMRSVEVWVLPDASIAFMADENEENVFIGENVYVGGNRNDSGRQYYVNKSGLYRLVGIHIVEDGGSATWWNLIKQDQSYGDPDPSKHNGLTPDPGYIPPGVFPTLDDLSGESTPNP